MKHSSLRKVFFSSEFLILIFGFSCLLSACILSRSIKKPRLDLSKQDTAINIQTILLQALSAGHRRLITDVLWVQTLLESDNEHYKGRDLNNWLYLRFNTISVLDPKFYQNYLYGGQFLNVVKDDLWGAEKIYEKGLRIYPHDYDLNFQLGFLYYFEIGDYSKGLQYLSRIEKHPRAPVFFQSIINKLRFQVGGDLEKIYPLVKLNYEATRDENMRNRLGQDLYAIKAEIDLECLNHKRSNCQTHDFDGNPYELRAGRFEAKKKFRLYRLKTRQDLKKSPN